MTGPCGWDPEVCADCGPLDSVDPVHAEAIRQQAAALLWTWTGRRFGACERTVSVCERCVRGCGCDRHPEVILDGPVGEIITVTVDGVVVEPADDVFRVDDYTDLVRIDGGGCLCKGNTRTWEVTYTQGFPIPPGGELMAGTLATEIAKAVCDDKTCRLPRRIQTLTRDDVTVGFLDAFTDVIEGRTGLWEVDAWVAANSPSVFIGAAVYSPDVKPPRHQTWPLIGVS